MSRTVSYWCYRCTRIARVIAEDAVECPYCQGEFIEAVDSHEPSPPQPRRRNTAERSSYNPVIVLRTGDEYSGHGGRGFELYYNHGAGSGLRPLPRRISEFLMTPGFNQLLDQLSEIEIHELRRDRHPPTSKSAAESIPEVDISELHVSTELHCAVCKEPFDLGNKACEMPCNHIYHPNCILPWLNFRKSCPVCRYELLPDSTNPSTPELSEESDEESTAVGLTIWRLPGGGFAVGRFAGGERGEADLPVVYTEIDGDLNNSFAAPRRIMWDRRRPRVREGGFRRAFRSVFSFFGRLNSNGNGNSRSMNRRNRSWIFGERNGLARW